MKCAQGGRKCAGRFPRAVRTLLAPKGPAWPSGECVAPGARTWLCSMVPVPVERSLPLPCFSCVTWGPGFTLSPALLGWYEKEVCR